MNKEILKEPKKLTTEDKLFLNKFKVDNAHPHIKLRNNDICRQCQDKPCLYVCPVGNYKKVNGAVELSWEGCLECGSCRIACKYDGIEWNYPQGGFGIMYRFG